MAQLSKFEDLQRNYEKLQEDLNVLQGRFEASEACAMKEGSRLNGLVHAAEARALDAELVRKTLEIDLASRYDQ